MSNFSTFSPIHGGLPGTAPKVFQATTVDLLPTVTAAGYLDDKGVDGSNEVNEGDIIILRYNEDVSPATTTFGYVTVTAGVYSFVQGIQNIDADSVALPEGSTLVGNSSGVGVAVDISPNGFIMIGNGTTAVPQPMSGAIIINNAGETSYVNGVLTNAAVAPTAAIDFSKLAALPSAQMLVGSAGNVATAVAISGDLTVSNTGVASLAPLSIENADISNTAAIAFSKLAALPSSQLLVGSAGNVATAVAVTGDIGIDNAGVTSISAGVITNADINGGAAIDYSKLANLPSSQILVGNALNVATPVSMSGDIAVDNAGVTSITAGSIVNADINAAAAISHSKLASMPMGSILVGSAAMVPTAVGVTGDIGLSDTGVASITAGAILNADINAAAAIDFSKLAALPSAQLLVGSGANVATAVAMSGDISLDNAGATAIVAGAIVNADVNAAAAIDFSKLATLTSGNLLVGSAGNVATSVAMSGDVTISNTGVTTIGAGTIDKAMLSAGITPSHMVVFANADVTTVGGAATEVFAVPGALATDAAFCQIVTQGTGTSILRAVAGADTLTVTFAADPTNSTHFAYQLLRATT